VPVIAGRAIPGAWCDTSTKLTAAVADSVRLAGHLGVARYLPLPGNDASQDIDATELLELTAANLQCLLVQHVRKPPWLPIAHDGAADAAHAVEHARAAGYPDGAHIFCDFEGVAGSPAIAFAFLDRWSIAVVDAGYRAGLYVGYSALLSPQQLFDLEHMTSYWSDSGPRTVAQRGFAIKQAQPEFTLDGVRFDRDIVTPDAFGETPYVAVP
jgi:hypothetical protein